MTLSPKNKQIAPLKDQNAFERLCVDIWRKLLKDPRAQLYGRSGQSQHGVDLFGRRRGTSEWVGVQCKVRTGGTLSVDDIKNDILAAYQMNPKLSEFIVATTTRRDKHLQDFARDKTTEHQNQGLFSIGFFFWEDIEDFLLDDANLDVLQRHYGDLLVEVLPAGVTLCKTLTLSIGVDEATGGYELVIGKTAAREDDEDYSGLNYYKNLAFIINANSREMSFFRLPCKHYTAIEDAIGNRTDAYIVTKWLNSFKNIDELLTSDAEEFSATITTEEWDSIWPHRERDDD